MKQIPFGRDDIVVLPAMLCRNCGATLTVRVKPVLGIISRGTWPAFIIDHPEGSCKYSDQTTTQSSEFYSGVRI